MGDISTWGAVLGVVAALISLGLAIIPLIAARTSDVQIRISGFSIQVKHQNPENPEQAAKIVDQYISENSTDRKGVSE